MDNAVDHRGGHLRSGTTPAPGRRVEDQLKQLILDRGLAPGDPLPPENELCAAFDVSRSRLREAVKTLAALDIVEVRRGAGTFVGAMRLTALVESLVFRGLLAARTSTPHLLVDLVDLREFVEVNLAARVLADLDAGTLRTMRRLTATMREKAGRDEEFRDEDREFHLRLVGATGSDLAVQLVGAFWDVHAVASRALEPARDLAAGAAAHERILDAVEAGDPAAYTEAVREHYQPIRRRLPDPCSPTGTA